MGRSRAPKKTEADLLFRNLAEQVKLPFIQIAHAAELSRMHPSEEKQYQLSQTISLTSAAALKMIDGYLLSVALQAEGRLNLEPVSISSVLYDTAQTLDAYARAHDCEIQLEVGGKYQPVMAQREAVESALTNLGYSFIEAASTAGKRSRITLAVRRTSRGISTGVFSENNTLSTGLFKQAKALKGMVKQPFSEFSPGSGAGVFVADALFMRLESAMHVARLHSQRGLAATLTPSLQLSLV